MMTSRWGRCANRLPSRVHFIEKTRVRFADFGFCSEQAGRFICGFSPHWKAGSVLIVIDSAWIQNGNQRNR